MKSDAGQTGSPLEALVRRALLESAEMHDIADRAREISLRFAQGGRPGVLPQLDSEVLPPHPEN